MAPIRTEIYIKPDTRTYDAINQALTSAAGAEGIRGPGEVEAEVSVVLGVIGAQQLTGLKVRFSRRKGLRVVAQRFDTLPFPEADVAKFVIRGRPLQANVQNMELRSELYMSEHGTRAQALRILGDIVEGHLVWRVEVRALSLADANEAFDCALRTGRLSPSGSMFPERASRAAPWSAVKALR